MIIEEFLIEDIKLKYFVGIAQIKLDSSSLELQQILELVNVIKNNYKNSYLQFFNDKYVLNTQHIYQACYFTQKSFYYETNISNQKELEFLLYLATKRQIKDAINDFGIDLEYLKKGIINLCIISSDQTINKIYNHVNTLLKAVETKFILNNLNIEKFNIISKYFGFSVNQITSILKSYNIHVDVENPNIGDLNSLYLALNDLICERMALLSLEKVSSV
ncbi:MAG: KEOPS complex subunit Cgi121 [Candidatus Thorarchaeota archaeon]